MYLLCVHKKERAGEGWKGVGMTGRLWMFSHLLDTDDLEFGSHEFITYKMGIKYYGMGEKKFTNAAWKSGTVYKCGKLVLIRRSIFEKYLRNEYMRNCCFVYFR